MIISIKDFKKFIFLFFGSISSQILNLINLSIIIKHFSNVEVANYFYLQAIIAIALAMSFLGYDKLALYQQKKINIHEENLSTHMIYLFFITILVLIFFNKSFYFTLNIFVAPKFEVRVVQAIVSVEVLISP
jgi:O-antigen/teichoic acid export membrane protein